MRMLKLSLTHEELSTLLELCLEELRTPPDQIRFILREEFNRRGLLEAQIRPLSKKGQAKGPVIVSSQ